MSFDDAQLQFYDGLLTGAQIDTFKLGTRISAGEFGLVYSATDIGTSLPLAVKLMPQNTDVSRNFEFARESELLRALQKRSHVVDLISSGDAAVPLVTGGAPSGRVPIDFTLKYIALEFADSSLEDLIYRDGFLDGVSPTEKLSLWRQAALAIHQMHQTNIVHRDLKSSNCLLFEDGTEVRCKVADLGRSRDLTQEQRPDVTYLNGRGDIRFAAPEHIYLQGKTDVRSQMAVDLYGLGSLFFESFSGLGLTSTVIRQPQHAMSKAIGEHHHGRYTELSSLRLSYRAAVDALLPAMPAQIRNDVKTVLYQLCDPEPLQRFPNTAAASRRSLPGYGSNSLEWLLRRIDILIKNISISSPGNQPKTPSRKRK